jgi:hypothetical protein
VACGIGVLEATLRLRTRIFVLTLMALPTLYVAYRVSGWSGEDVVQIVTETISAERAESIAYRLRNENLLVEKALQRPAFGWGRWGRFFVTDRAGRPVSVPDGMWVIRLGSTGLVGLAALGLFIALPVLALLRRVPPRAWKDPRVAPAAAAAVVLLLWGVDDVLNSFLNPVFMLVAGALTGLCHGSAELAARRPVGAGGGPGLPRAAPWRPTPGAAPP